MFIQRLCVIGVGLIGGSLARDLRRLGACAEFVGCGRSRANLERAVELGIVDRYATRVGEAVADADVVVVAVPLGAMAGVFSQMAGKLARDAVVTDVGSAKMSVIEAAREAFGTMPQWFVPGHPIAGTERSGVDAAIDDLFHQRRVILTPERATSAAALARVREMWEKVGADVVETDPSHHDQVLAATSHLPHMLAYTLVDALAKMDDRAEIFDYAAGGFRDFTRIASSDPQMWHDICVANRTSLVGALEHFSAELAQVTAAVKSSDSAFIRTLFERAKAKRDEYANKR